MERASNGLLPHHHPEWEVPVVPKKCSPKKLHKAGRGIQFWGVWTIEDIPHAKAGDHSKPPGTGQEETSTSGINSSSGFTSSCLALKSDFQSPHEQFQVLRSCFLQGSRKPPPPTPCPPFLHRSMIHSNISKFNVTSEVQWREDPYYGSEAAVECDYCPVLWQTSPLAFKLILKYFCRNSQQYKP